jgi:hypothetical protein
MSKIDFTELAGLLIGHSREGDHDLLQTSQLMEMTDALSQTMPPEVIANARAHICEYLLNNHATAEGNMPVYKKLTEPDEYGLTALDRLRSTINGANYGEESQDASAARRQECFRAVCEKAVEVAAHAGMTEPIFAHMREFANPTPQPSDDDSAEQEPQEIASDWSPAEMEAYMARRDREQGIFHPNMSEPQDGPRGPVVPDNSGFNERPYNPVSDE